MFNKKYSTGITIGICGLLVVIISMAFILGSGYSKNSTEVSQEPEYMTKLFDKNKVLQINIDIDKKDFEDLKENAIDEEYYKANITINGQTYDNVGIRAKGNSSLYQVATSDNTNRYSFKIKLDEYVDNQNVYGLSKFVLNNNIGDATSMKEYMSYDLFNKMNVSTPGFAYAYIKINNEDWGLYLAVEPLEEEFLERNYGSSDGNLYKVETAQIDGNGFGEIMQQGHQGSTQDNNELSQSQQNEVNVNTIFEAVGKLNGNGGNLVYKDDNISSYPSIFDYTVLDKTGKSDEKRLIKCIKNLNEGVDLEKSIDVDEVLRYFAVNTFLVNLDSYSGNIKHNYYLYEDSGMMQIVPWDLNLSFGAFFKLVDQMGGIKEGISLNQKVINFPIDAPVTDSMEGSPLISNLLAVDEYKERYHKYLQQIRDEYINSGYFCEEINKVDKLISSYIEKDPTAFYTYDEYKKSLPGLKQYGIDRVKSIEEQIEGSQPSENYGNEETTVDIDALGGQTDNIVNDEQQENMNNKMMEMMMKRKNIIKVGDSIIPVNILVLAVSTLIMIIALIFITKFRRKRVHC